MAQRVDPHFCDKNPFIESALVARAKMLIYVTQAACNIDFILSLSLSPGCYKKVVLAICTRPIRICTLFFCRLMGPGPSFCSSTAPPRGVHNWLHISQGLNPAPSRSPATRSSGRRPAPGKLLSSLGIVGLWIRQVTNPARSFEWSRCNRYTLQSNTCSDEITISLLFSSEHLYRLFTKRK